jgi:predicted alpha/beta hydrolase family esterase
MNALPKEFNFISIPGIGGSGEEHWQSLWARMNPELITVEQDEWKRPWREKWVDRIVETIEANNNKPVILVAHSLACITCIFAVADKRLEGVVGIYMVAPADSDRPTFPKECKNFSPIPRIKIDIPSIVVASENDDWCSIEKAQKIARWTGSKFVNIGKKGHVTALSGVGLWEVGFELLRDFASMCPTN